MYFKEIYGWNGTMGGQIVNPGVYTFYARVRYLDGITAEYKGDINLLR